ncbi:MBL fold hydrolase [Rouxiella silvae]|uniref:MBL fold hydrolase n=1 Tax=Rouxiella silvae TaxID=1646373 RepID=A0AA41BYB1_9GAMM|nr:N-acyl homoserine lactonase family protein [Rouxiella silvae]KQN48222.1 MBL fold metallo-hydrolase [Serratia sp. Leaf50]MBF6638458.1 N-acyl homoserine lactonase family protein [Rouxiella silvae]ORJ20151.1 MBL fold hydrolase [Rouxiella silvae]
MSSESEQYQIYAIKYAHHDRMSSENFIGGDPHDVPMPLDYFVWAIVGTSETYVVDMGFDAEMANRRGRTIVHSVEQGLGQLGIRVADVKQVVITHMHYDHAGNHSLFPQARFHVQDSEMAFCTGRCMCHHGIRHAFEVEDVKSMVEKIFAGRVQFHDGDSELAPGITLHRVGGHSDGLQVVRVNTARGWVVLASDASHYYANMQRNLAYPIVYNIGDMLEGYATLRRLADSDDHIIPGHDPLVLQYYPAFNADTQGWIARVDADPRRPD